MDPAAYSDKDLDELCATLASLENAVVVLGSVFEMERNKLKLGKRAQKLIAQCTKVGFAEELAKPKPYELKVMVMDRAKRRTRPSPRVRRRPCWNAAAKTRSFSRTRWTSSVRCPATRP